MAPWRNAVGTKRRHATAVDPHCDDDDDDDQDDHNKNHDHHHHHHNFKEDRYY